MNILDDETRMLLTTKEVAHLLNMKPNTLRNWSWSGKGPITPLKIGRSLHWDKEEVRKLIKNEREGA